MRIYVGTGYMKYDFDYLRKAQARSAILLQASNFATVCLDFSSILFCNYRNALPIGLEFGQPEQQACQRPEP